MTEKFTWIPFYEETATVLRDWKSKQQELIQILDRLRHDGLKVTPLMDKNDSGGRSLLREIDPFTFFGSFNRGITKDQRLAIVKGIKDSLKIRTPVPLDFTGVPVVNNQSSWFIAYQSDRDAKDVDRLWRVFEIALGKDPVNSSSFLAAFDEALKVKQTNINLTMGLFWIRPQVFLNLDKVNRDFLHVKLPTGGLSARFYVEQIKQASSSQKSFPELSFEAWEAAAQNDSSGLARDYTRLVEPPPVSENEPADGLMTKMQKNPLNHILFGPPGTGKTWITAQLAVEICNGSAPSDRGELMHAYNELVRTNRVAFTTFHQSIGYEEFVEGLRPITDSDDDGDGQSSVGFHLESRNGIFRDICALAEQARKRGRRPGNFDFAGRQFFKMSLGRASTEGHIYDAAIEGKYIILGWGGDIDWSNAKYEDYQAVFNRWQKEEPGASGNSGNISQLWRFRSSMKKGDIVIVSDGNFRFRAIGEVTGDYQFQPQSEGWNHRRSVRWLAVLDEFLPIETIHDGKLSQASCYLLTTNRIKLDALAEQIATEPAPSSSTPEPFVLIIDEINRANVSKVLGELITLLEPDKRLGEGNALTVRLPYSKDDFGVPNNLYIIGTMNTADRSIALLDTALRRRFHFTEMMPDYSCIDKEVSGIHLGKLLYAINRRVEWLFDRDHQIGHGFFTEIEDKAALDHVMQAKVIPLLGEYFYEDWEKVRVALNDNGAWFIGVERLPAPVMQEEGEDRSRYSISKGEIPIDGYIAAAAST